MGLWETGGLQHVDIHAVGLFGPPCARWLVLGAVVSLVASLAEAAVVGVCVGGARVACVLSPGAGRRPGPLWGAFSAFIL